VVLPLVGSYSASAVRPSIELADSRLLTILSATTWAERANAASVAALSPRSMANQTLPGAPSQTCGASDLCASPVEAMAGSTS
jgi:hypothetical protein